MTLFIFVLRIFKLNRDAPIGIFDSGIGGLSVYKKIRELLPLESVMYVADQIHLPYGSKDLDMVFNYAKAITEFLLSKGCKLIVIACNTACAAALHPLRRVYPSTDFVGMEPAVKPAALRTRTGAVGILATEGTFKGEPYNGVIKRFAQGVKVYEQPCHGLAEAIENGIDDSELHKMLEGFISPLKLKNIDQLALACTHYPLVFDHICKIAGNAIEVIDPAEAIARRVLSLLSDSELLATSPYEGVFYTTAATSTPVSEIVRKYFDSVNRCAWSGEQCLEML